MSGRIIFWSDLWQKLTQDQCLQCTPPFEMDLLLQEARRDRKTYYALPKAHSFLLSHIIFNSSIQDILNGCVICHLFVTCFTLPYSVVRCP